MYIYITKQNIMKTQTQPIEIVALVFFLLTVVLIVVNI